MIITRLDGGLGNQMFQYAAGKALAQHHGVPFGLDRRVFDGPAQFDYGLHHFDISSQTPKQSDLPPLRTTSKLRYLAWRAGLFGPKLVRQVGDAFDPAFLENGPESYLSGYWQSERFFAACATDIRKDFKIITPASDANRALAETIEASNAVSLHVRRGDYVSDPRANATHGLCTMDYYEQALSHIANAAKGDIEVFVFSDDPAWAHDNMHLAYKRTIVDLNDSDHQYEDLRLMSLCKHNIIANSSFSWWGAWLNRNTEKTVVAPSTWFRQAGKSNPDICPPEWVRI